MRKLAHHDWKEVVRLKKWIAATLATVAIIAMGVAAAAFAATPAQPGSPKIIKIMGKNGYIGTMVLRGNKYVLSGPQGAARTSEGGNNVGAPPGWSEVVCAGGPGGETIVLGPADELPPGLVSAVLAALERGTAWYATKDGQTVLFLSGEPDPEDGHGVVDLARHDPARDRRAELTRSRGGAGAGARDERQAKAGGNAASN